jgi:hypothetical protein
MLSRRHEECACVRESIQGIHVITVRLKEVRLTPQRAEEFSDVYETPCLRNDRRWDDVLAL